MKGISLKTILRNWILVLACCTLAAVVLDIIFSGFGDRERISTEMERNSLPDEQMPEDRIQRSAFDSVRNEHLKSRELNPDSIINL